MVLYMNSVEHKLEESEKSAGFWVVQLWGILFVCFSFLSIFFPPFFYTYSFLIEVNSDDISVSGDL